MNKKPLLAHWLKIKSRKRCPVCKFDKSYQGLICPSCSKWFTVQPNGMIKRKIEVGRKGQ